MPESSSARWRSLSIVVACTVPDLERPWTLGTPGMVFFFMWLMHPVDVWYARRVRTELGIDPQPA